MSYRTFVDGDGSYWQVWESLPTKFERRSDQAERRRPKTLPWKGAERRAGSDRRVTNQRRILLAQGFGSGWLTFESLLEKRRLNPIPSHWETMSEPDLRALCEKARRVARFEDTSAA